MRIQLWLLAKTFKPTTTTKKLLPTLNLICVSQIVIQSIKNKSKKPVSKKKWILIIARKLFGKPFKEFWIMDR